MDIKEFTKRFKVMSLDLKYAPKDDEAAGIWYAKANAQMSHDEIVRAFNVCSETMKEWPAWIEFKEAGQKGAVLDLDNEASLLTGKIMAKFSDPKAVPESSIGLKWAVGDEIYNFLGGHMYWYDVMNGAVKMPTETQMQKKILAFLKDRKNDETNERLSLGGTDVKRLPTAK